MDFPVAVDDSNFMAHHWVETSDENSIPSDFVVNTRGTVVWMGNPVDLDAVLPKVLNNTWHTNEASSKRIFNKHLKELDSRAGDSLRSLYYRWYKLDDLERADSDLLAIREMIRKEPKLKYAPVIAYTTFWALLITNPHEAYMYGKKVITTSTYQEPDYGGIIDDIGYCSHEIKIPEEIYRLGAETYQAEIDNTNPVYRELLDVPRMYHEMAVWYRLACDSSKAVAAEQKATEWKTMKKKATGAEGN